eukprot:Awhi_evm1s11046
MKDRESYNDWDNNNRSRYPPSQHHHHNNHHNNNRIEHSTSHNNLKGLSERGHGGALRGNNPRDLPARPTSPQRNTFGSFSEYRYENHRGPWGPQILPPRSNSHNIAPDLEYEDPNNVTTPKHCSNNNGHQRGSMFQRVDSDDDGMEYGSANDDSEFHRSNEEVYMTHQSYNHNYDNSNRHPVNSRASFNSNNIHKSNGRPNSGNSGNVSPGGSRSSAHGSKGGGRLPVENRDSYMNNDEINSLWTSNNNDYHNEPSVNNSNSSRNRSGDERYATLTHNNLSSSSSNSSSSSSSSSSNNSINNYNENEPYATLTHTSLNKKSRGDRSSGHEGNDQHLNIGSKSSRHSFNGNEPYATLTHTNHTRRKSNGSNNEHVYSNGNQNSNGMTYNDGGYSSGGNRNFVKTNVGSMISGSNTSNNEYEIPRASFSSSDNSVNSSNTGSALSGLQQQMGSCRISRSGSPDFNSKDQRKEHIYDNRPNSSNNSPNDNSESFIKTKGYGISTHVGDNDSDYAIACELQSTPGSGGREFLKTNVGQGIGHPVNEYASETEVVGLLIGQSHASINAHANPKVTPSNEHTYANSVEYASAEEYASADEPYDNGNSNISNNNNDSSNHNNNDSNNSSLNPTSFIKTNVGSRISGTSDFPNEYYTPPVDETSSSHALAATTFRKRTAKGAINTMSETKGTSYKSNPPLSPSFQKSSNHNNHTNNNDNSGNTINEYGRRRNNRGSNLSTHSNNKRSSISSIGSGHSVGGSYSSSYSNSNSRHGSFEQHQQPQPRGNQEISDYESETESEYSDDEQQAVSYSDYSERFEDVIISKSQSRRSSRSGKEPATVMIAGGADKRNPLVSGDIINQVGDHLFYKSDNSMGVVHMNPEEEVTRSANVNVPRLSGSPSPQPHKKDEYANVTVFLGKSTNLK